MIKHFLGWKKPISILSAEKLISYQKKGKYHAIDLSHILVVIPTKQSGRLLESELLKIAEKQEMVLFPPEFKTPLNLLELPEESPNSLDEQTSMMEAISSFIKLPYLFPQGIPKMDNGRFDAAKTICTLRSTLAEQGLSIADAEKNEVIQQNEPERWKDLTKLETKYKEILNRRGYIDRTEALIKASHNATEKKYDKVIVVSVPDPLPLAINALIKISNDTDVEIWINAPDSEKDSFNNFGVPIEGSFEKSDCLFDENLSVVCKPEDAAEKSIQILSEKGETSVDDIALALFTEELIIPFSDSYNRRGYSTYDPAGETCGKGVLFNLIRDFIQFFATEEIEHFLSLLRNPHFTEFITKSSSDRNQFLKQLDEYHDNTLPTNAKWFYNTILMIPEDTRYSFLKNCFSDFPASLKAVLLSSEKLQIIDILINFLSDIYSSSKTFIDDNQNELFQLKAEKISTVLKEFSEKVSEFNISTKEISRLLLSNIENSNVYIAHSANSIPLQGWLEMNWTPASYVILAGFNEGYIPDSITADLLLPESARKSLRIKNNSQRMTRDLFLMRTLMESRKESLYTIVLKTTSQGDPLKPSRILFACNQEKLVDRALYLFAENSPQSFSKPLTSERYEEKLLKPNFDNLKIEKLSVTSLKNYLTCPFRFYLGSIKKMEHLYGNANEMDNRMFGTLCHWAIEQYGKYYNEDQFDVSKVEQFLKTKLIQKAHNKFGEKFSLAVELQLENLKRRLEKAAIVEVESRVEGWEIIESEFNVEYVIDNIKITGKIDRIEYNKTLKYWRIIDFKTSSKAEDPEKGHFSKKITDDLPEEFCFFAEGENSKQTWINLQLPLYIYLLDKSESVVASDGEKFNSSLNNFDIGYFNLPDAISETGLYFWKNYSSSITNAASICAEEIITRIKNYVFWPPNNRVQYDNFEELHTGDLIENIDLAIGE